MTGGPPCVRLPHMKTLIASFAVALAVAVPSSPATQPVGPPTLVGSSWPTGLVQIDDTWHPFPAFARDYSTCDAVAAVYVHGIYDYGIDKATGDLWVAVGLTNKGNGVELNIDGLHQGCFH